MSMEYCVQVKTKNGEWEQLGGLEFNEISLAKRELGVVKCASGGRADLRIACREVSDWCGCKEVL